MTQEDPSVFDPAHYWETRLRKHWGLQGVGRLGFGTAYNRWAYRIQRQVLLKRLAETGVDFSQTTVLDIGSGVGFYVDCWLSLGVKHLVGVDITQVVTDSLKQKYPNQEFYQLDISGNIAALAGRSFDCASAIAVLFHVVDDERYAQAFRNVFDVLKPGALFVFTEEFLHHETVRATHVVYRSLQQIEQIVHDSGFEIVERVPFHFLMNYPDDTQVRLLQRLWQAMAALLSIHEVCGFLIGAGLYPLERLAVSVARESPTSELMICRKPY